MAGTAPARPGPLSWGSPTVGLRWRAAPKERTGRPRPHPASRPGGAAARREPGSPPSARARRRDCGRGPGRAVTSLLRRGRRVASRRWGRAGGGMIGTVLCYVLLPAARLLRALRGNLVGPPRSGLQKRRAGGVGLGLAPHVARALAAGQGSSLRGGAGAGRLEGAAAGCSAAAADCSLRGGPGCLPRSCAAGLGRSLEVVCSEVCDSPRTCE